MKTAIVIGLLINAIMFWEHPKSLAEAHKAKHRENALGRYQIRPIFVDECNRIAGLWGLKERWTHRDALNKFKARRMVALYIAYVQTVHPEYTPAQIAQTYNGGWNAVPLYQATEYGEKVQEKYNELVQEAQ